MTTILIAEDDANIREGLVTTLESEGYQVVCAENGKKAIEALEKRSFDLVVLDVMMPEKSGYEVCRELRKQDTQTPVLMLTAKGEEIDKVVGLELGADDYVTKPFGIRELLARIAALLRRSQSERKPPSPAEAFNFGPARIRPKSYECLCNNQVHSLSARELHLITLFHQRPGEVLDRDTLLNEVWGIDYLGTTRTLDQHIAQLRKKVEATPAQPKTIVTVHGVGYRYQV